MKNEFTLAFNEVLEEKQLPKEVILTALESAMVSAYRRSVNASTAQHVEAKIDPETGKVQVYAEKEIVDVVNDERTEVSLEDALKVDPEAELGGMVIVETTPKNFGRAAAQTARQVIQQRIRDAERQLQLDFYQKQIGEIVSGIVQAINVQGLTIGLEMRAEANMSRKDMIPKERFHIHDRVRALIAEVKDTPRGPQINLSRTHRDFLRRLLENEVPEIYHGVVEIRSIAREPGERAKVAVMATQSGIDPVGACVGIRGVRIQAIVRELHDEKIDVIEWNDDAAAFIAKAISPARVLGVYLREDQESSRTATVVVPEDQLSLAIGRDGQNARLAAKLTGWRIDIKSLPEAASDALYRLQQEAALAELAEKEKDTLAEIDALLARKNEGRPLNPEEYDKLVKFVDRVEKATTARVEPEVVEPVAEEVPAVRQLILDSAFETDILDSNLPEHIAIILQGAGYRTVGDVALQMKLEPDRILGLDGIGARSIEKINTLVDSILIQPEQVEEAVGEESAEVVEQPALEVEVKTVEETLMEETPETVEEPVVAEELLAESEVVEQALEAEAAVVEQEAQPEPQPKVEEKGKAEDELSFEELFKQDAIDVEPRLEEEEEEEPALDITRKKKKKRKSVQVEYDPDRDMVVRKKKHKRGGGLDDWDWEA